MNYDKIVEHASCTDEVVPGIRDMLHKFLQVIHATLKAVLDGELAVPCNLQPALAGSNSQLRPG